MKKIILFALLFSFVAFAIQTVENGETLNGNSKFSIKLEKRIVLEPEDSDLIIAKISDIAVDNKGNIFIVDLGSTKVYKYDKTGKFLLSFGKKGQGPGEFQRVYRIAVDSKGHLYIPDSGISKFTNTGKFIFKKKASATQLLDSFIPLKGGDFIVGKVTLDESGKVIKFVRTIELVNKDLNPVKELFRVSEEAGKNGQRGNRAMFFNILALEKNKIYRLTNNNNILTVDIYNGNGEVIQKAVKKYKKVKKTAEQIKKEEEWVEKQKKRIGGRFQYEIDKNKKSVINSKLDERYNLWIKTIGDKSEDKTTYFDIIDMSGHYVGRISTGKIFSVWTVKNSYLYCVEDNEDDGYCVYKYKIIAK